jgi:hypothetical protein
MRVIRIPMRALLLLVTATVLLSACLTPAPQAPMPTVDPVKEREAVYDLLKSLLEGVPCQAPSVVDTANSANFLYVANASWDRQGTHEIEIRGDLLFGVHGAGISIVNVSNPMAPRILSNWTESPGALDVKVSPDNMTALIGVGNGVHLIDVRDPEEPVLAGTYLFPSNFPGGLPLQNAHMLFTAGIAGEQWVFIAPNTSTGVWILKLVGEPDARSLEFVTTTLPVQGGPLGPHDMVVQYDELLKTHLLYSADGYHGWSVFDVSDPSQPELVGGFVRPETGYLHTIQAQMINNRRIVATIAEVGGNFMQVYDATNLRAPVLLATWQVGTVIAAQHNFNIVAGLMYVAHYGQGIFVFDLNELPTTPSSNVVQFPPIAHWEGRPGVTNATFWDIVLKDGVLFGSDMNNGVDVFAFGCVVPGDKSYTSIN